MSSRGPPGHPAPTRGTTQPAPPPGGFGELSFVKHVKNIGRAYRKQATVLVACYRERIAASKGSDHRSTELRKVARFLDEALGFAAHTSEATSEEVGKMFDKAVQELNKYEEKFHRKDRTVIQKMEEAKEKDLRSLGALTKLKKKQTDDWSAPPNLKTVNIVPLLDPSLGIVRMELDPRSSFSEIIWRLSRLRDRERITPGQHPFFYRLPITVNDEYKLYPIEDFQAVFSHNVYVLVDKPGRVFIESEPRNLTFLDVWIPKYTLIFKDVFGSLVGEWAALAPQVTPDVRFWHSVDSSRANLFPSSLAGVASATRNDQLNPATGTNADPGPIAPGGSVANRRELVHPTWNSRGINVYISIQRTGILPPIYTLNDDVLLGIFSSYRLDDDENWNLQLGWHNLTRVCRKWRHLIYGSPSHLDIHLLCTNGTPVADMLNDSPPLPLIINYQDTCAIMTAEDEEGILLALQHHDRVRRIVLHAPPQGLHKFLTAMNENFVTLERLSILSTSGDAPRLVMPRAFRAARLSHLTLLGVTLSSKPRSLSPTVSLVSLTLTNIRASPHVPLEDLTAQLRFVLLLNELSICFSVPIPRSRIQMRGIETQITRATLPTLIRFISHGLNTYLEGILAQISDPCLRKFDITLFNQLILALPVISRFIDATAEIRFPVAKINFCQNSSFSISISDNREEVPGADRSVCVEVSCRPFDWQVSYAAQICNALWWMLPGVEELAVGFSEHGPGTTTTTMPPESRKEVDSRTWRHLLVPFKSVKKLQVGRALTSDLSRALHPAEEQQQLPVGLSLVPMLQELVLEDGCDVDAFAAFIDARRRVGRPVCIRGLPVIRPSPLRRDSGAAAGAKANILSSPSSSLSRLPRRGNHISSSQRRPMPISLNPRICSLIAPDLSGSDSEASPSTPTRSRSYLTRL